MTTAEELRSAAPRADAEGGVCPNKITDARLRANVAWILAGNLWQGFSQWMLIVALAKLGTIEMVGSFTLALAIGLPVLMFGSLSLRSIQVTDGSRAYRFLEFFTVRLAMALASFITIAAIAVAARYPASVMATVLLIGAAKAVESLSDIFYGLLQREERMAGIGISMMLRGTLSVFTLGAALWLTGSLLWGAAALLVSALFTLLAFDLPRSLALLKIGLPDGLRECGKYARELANAPACRRLGTLAYAGLPLGAVLMLVSLNLNLPRYFIEHNLGLRELGMFSSLTNLLAAGNVVINALGQGAIPRLAKHFEAARMRDFRALLTAIVAASVAVGAIGVLGALLFGRQILAVLYRPEYSAHWDVLVWLMAAAGFFYVGCTLGCAVTAAKCFTPQLPLFAIAAAATTVASMVLVPSQGLRGAALAILISALVQCAGGVWLLRKACQPALASPTQAPIPDFSNGL
jgi:O-antigen/teichoic acid export membrane protein